MLSVWLLRRSLSVLGPLRIFASLLHVGFRGSYTGVFHITRAAIGVHLVTAVVGAVGITQGREGPGELLGGISNHLACGKAICPLWTAV